MPPAPVNHRKQTNTPEAIAQAADYAITILDGYSMWWRYQGPPHDVTCEYPFKGMRLLEIGPGATLGGAVLLSCTGATVSVADRFLAAWDPDFHGPFYAELLRKVESRGAAFSAPIRRLIEARGFTPDVITCHAIAAEELWRIGERFDIVFSNAVIEHVESLEATTQSLAAVTRVGGHGFHQIDLRDHRDFDRPLEFLTLPPDGFVSLRDMEHCEIGGPWRLPDVKAAFEAAGFLVTHSGSNLSATPEYLADVRPRLHSRYRHYTEAELAALSALFVMSRAASARWRDHQSDRPHTSV
jgi:hypothetical protein